jgi:ABC-type bacteriocin/lantibiotic exporter with double-glycine peptidase domain
VAPGQKVHLSDPSGAGKTTLLRVLAGLYPPDRGTVTIGGLAPAAASGAMLYLPQFATLYAGSLLENLRLFSAGADEPAILSAARQTGLDDYVQLLPMKYHTMVASNGNFSGGQRQLILLTAALASDRPLLLLDEPISQLDAVVQRRIAVAEAFVSKTIIYASHTAMAFTGGSAT